MNIDFHSHILPEADHGSSDLDTSLDMVCRAQMAGIDLMIATPHFYPAVDSFSRFAQRRSRCAHTLSQALREMDAPKLMIGAEVHLCEGLEHLEELDQLCIEGTRTLLLEMPFGTRWTDAMYRTVEALCTERDLEIVLAHIERYPVQQMDELMQLLDVKAQVNASVLCRRFKRRRILSLIEQGRVHALGSDAHQYGPQYEEYAQALEVLGLWREPLMARTARLIGAVP